MTKVTAPPSGWVYHGTGNHGNTLPRMGISRDVPQGTKWRNIVKPDRSENLVQISAGQYGVWAVAASGLCYIRSGVSCYLFSTDSLQIGTLPLFPLMTHNFP